MENERIAAILYLAVFFKARFKERLRFKMPADERDRLLSIRESTQAVIDACQATQAGMGSAETTALIERVCPTICNVVESYVPNCGRTMGYRLKAHIRMLRGEERKKKDGEEHGGGEVAVSVGEN